MQEHSGMHLVTRSCKPRRPSSGSGESRDFPFESRKLLDARAASGTHNDDRPLDGVIPSVKCDALAELTPAFVGLLPFSSTLPSFVPPGMACFWALACWASGGLNCRSEKRWVIPQEEAVHRVPDRWTGMVGDPAFSIPSARNYFCSNDMFRLNIG